MSNEFSRFREKQKKTLYYYDLKSYRFINVSKKNFQIFFLKKKKNPLLHFITSSPLKYASSYFSFAINYFPAKKRSFFFLGLKKYNQEILIKPD
jgi:hypothetical protein